MTSFAYHLMGLHPVGFTLTVESTARLEAREPADEAFRSDPCETSGWTCSGKAAGRSYTLDRAFDHYWYVRGRHRELSLTSQPVEFRAADGSAACRLSVPIDFPAVPRISARLVPLQGGGFMIAVAGGGRRPEARASVNARDTIAAWTPLRLEPGYWSPHEESDLPDPRTGYVYTIMRAGKDYQRYYAGVPPNAHILFAYRNPVTGTEAALEFVYRDLFTAAQLSGQRPESGPAPPPAVGTGHEER